MHILFCALCIVNNFISVPCALSFISFPVHILLGATVHSYSLASLRRSTIAFGLPKCDPWECELFRRRMQLFHQCSTLPPISVQCDAYQGFPLGSAWRSRLRKLRRLLELPARVVAVSPTHPVLPPWEDLSSHICQICWVAKLFLPGIVSDSGMSLELCILSDTVDTLG